MRTTHLLSAACLLLAAAGLQAKTPQNEKGGVPVLLELFTSEGCSDCPPADKLLGELDQQQPFKDARLVVLSEHVDYWNHSGWVDPFSSSIYSKRQGEYAEQFGSDDVYTPQLVIDGARQVVGSRRAAIADAIQQSAVSSKIPIALKAERDAASNKLRAQVDVSGSASAAGAVYIALAMDHQQSDVARGENAGRHLSHTAVVFSIQQVGTLGTDGFRKEIEVPLGAKAGTPGLRVVVFIQDPKTKRILGVSEVEV